MAEVTLTSGYGTGLSDKQKQANGWMLEPEVNSVDNKTIPGNGSGNATPLSTRSTISYCDTATNQTHVSLADGILGQVKTVIFSTKGDNEDLVITPDNFANGTSIALDEANTSVTFCFDGTNWQIIMGEFTGTAEMVIT